MFENLIVAARDRKRLAEITAVLGRFGLDSLIARLGRGGDEAPGTPERARLAIEALGPTFIKLGQILATRSDLLSPDWIVELEKLHSTAPTLPFEELRPAVEAALGDAPEAVFAEFEAEPVAAASIAQVHRARLADGRNVAVKIRRPGIRPLMEADLRLIAAMARTIEAKPSIARLRPREIVAQLSEAVLAELDFTQEGRNADRFRANFARRPNLIVPDIHWELSSETLLVMDFVEGVPMSDAARLTAAGIDPAAIAALGAEVVLQMVLIDGFFHGDPHPGNLLGQPGDRIALLDFGMVGHVSPKRREELLGFVQSITGRDPDRLADLLGNWTEHVDRAAVEAAAARLVERHGQGRLILARVVEDIMALLRQHALAMPADLVLTFKALITLDGVLGRIDPDFDLTAATRRAWLMAMRARLSPGAVRDRMSSLMLELATVEDNLPRLIRAATTRLTDPTPPPPRPDRTLPVAVLAGAAMIAGAILLS
ncbi:AarF/UbiB family protein [Sphingosinicella sp. LHD-64]|uniref:ABC1 kinase family protein n=1 Tax=Sphingosinicella sp. LHD-64 TaxID=3072139 RepID=UPI00280CA1AB|nr:AarF/UbiB family protein [Sphingosinicella sp. LHD-64]MDQ8755093.1 AarF/UbiB family protein [Sphingosinicella sp. LHD-64]